MMMVIMDGKCSVMNLCVCVFLQIVSSLTSATADQFATNILDLLGGLFSF